MKKTIAYMASALVAAFALTSCLNEDQDPNATYPDVQELGNWEAEYVDGDYTYVASLTVAAPGDTVCAFSKINKETGETVGVTNGEITYDSQVGMTTAIFLESPEGPTPCEVYLARQFHNDGRMSIVYYAGSGDDRKRIANFSAVPVKGFAVRGGTYMTDDELYGVAFNNDDTCGYAFGEKGGDAKWEFDIETGTGSLVDDETGEVFTLSVNEKNQLVISDGNESHAIFRV